MNHKKYYQTNLLETYKKAKFKYTLSSNPHGPIKVANINYKVVEDPQQLHDPRMNDPKTNALISSRAPVIESTRNYYEERVRREFGYGIYSIDDSLENFYNRQGVSAFNPGSGIGEIGT